MAKKTNVREMKLRVDALPRRPAAGYLECYSNNANLTLLPLDVQLRFSTIVSGASGDAEAVDQCVVTMTYAHAKSLAVLLESQLSEHEKRNGPITPPTTPRKQ